MVIGQSLGPYRVLEKLGEGGMGEVYRARDTKLGRDVALKVLPPAFTADADRVARFEREARLLASLNHPHIGSIYGLEDSGSSPALVLELVEGDTLADRLRQGPMPLAEALTVARQIADALEAAHAAGIIHRDLKPSNIKMTRDGMVKVLDFGLARALGADGSGPDLATSATMTARTVPGVILGTAAYMSPEQARGRTVDKRTDVWAFGCVLFEMLAGSSAFGRETFTDSIAAVVGAEPDWASLPSGTPTGIRRVLTRCLEKDGRRRLHDIADARIELEDAMAAPAVPAPVAWAATWTRPALLALLIGSALTAGVLWLARDRFGRPAETPPDARVERLTDLLGLEESPAISPDGKSVAFTAGGGGRRQLFVQLVAGGAPLQLTRDAADHEYPRWSPDSSSIFYFSAAAPGELQGSVWEIPALGGVPRRVVNSVGGADVNPTDGRLALFRLTKEGIQLVTAAADGSSVAVVATFAPATHYL
jgi:eukaryotic-like serine/threonine-protein kinase